MVSKSFGHFHPENFGVSWSNLTLAFFSDGLKLNHQLDHLPSINFWRIFVRFQLSRGSHSKSSLVLKGRHQGREMSNPLEAHMPPVDFVFVMLNQRWTVTNYISLPFPVVSLEIYELMLWFIPNVGHLGWWILVLPPGGPSECSIVTPSGPSEWIAWKKMKMIAMQPKRNHCYRLQQLSLSC